MERHNNSIIYYFCLQHLKADRKIGKFFLRKSFYEIIFNANHSGVISSITVLNYLVIDWTIEWSGCIRALHWFYITQRFGFLWFYKTKEISYEYFLTICLFILGMKSYCWSTVYLYIKRLMKKYTGIPKNLTELKQAASKYCNKIVNE